MSVLKIQRSVALQVFEFCGWKTATNWDNARMAKKLPDVASVLPEKDIPDELKEVISDILTTTAEDGTFEVLADEKGSETSAETELTDGDESTATAPKAAKVDKEKDKAGKAEEKAAAKAAADEAKAKAKADATQAKADKKAADDAAKTAAKADKAAKPEKAPKEPKPEKDPSNNRMYTAAFVLREFGSIVEPDNATSNELAAKVDAMVGRPNTRESLNYLKNARKCIAGWLAGTPPVEEAAE